MSQLLVNVNVWSHNVLLLWARSVDPQGPRGRVEVAGDHHRLAWMLVTFLVISYRCAPPPPLASPTPRAPGGDGGINSARQQYDTHLADLRTWAHEQVNWTVLCIIQHNGGD